MTTYHVTERYTIRIRSRWIIERKRFTTIDELIGIVQEETR